MSADNIEITDKYIKIEDKIYYRENIKTLEFVKEESNLKSKIINFVLNITFFGIIYLLMIIPIFFIKNIYTISSALIATLCIIGSFATTSTKYSIMIGAEKIYTTENEKEFLGIKEKIIGKKLK